MAKKETRYNQGMDKTIKFVEENIAEGFDDKNTKVCNTGLILYTLDIVVLDMATKIYNQTLNLRQPECQILWTVTSYKHRDMIKVVPFREFDILWRNPRKADLYCCMQFWE